MSTFIKQFAVFLFFVSGHLEAAKLIRTTHVTTHCEGLILPLAPKGGAAIRMGMGVMTKTLKLIETSKISAEHGEDLEAVRASGGILKALFPNREVTLDEMIESQRETFEFYKSGPKHTYMIYKVENGRAGHSSHPTHLEKDRFDTVSLEGRFIKGNWEDFVAGKEVKIILTDDGVRSWLGLYEKWTREENFDLINLTAYDEQGSNDEYRLEESSLKHFMLAGDRTQLELTLVEQVISDRHVMTFVPE